MLRKTTTSGDTQGAAIAKVASRPDPSCTGRRGTDTAGSATHREKKRASQVPLAPKNAPMTAKEGLVAGKEKCVGGTEERSDDS